MPRRSLDLERELHRQSVLAELGRRALLAEDPQEVLDAAAALVAADAADARLQAGVLDLVAAARARCAREEDLRRAALHEPLTGLANRALLADRAAHELAARRRTGEDVVLVYVDLDDFKPVNDRLGHEAGDEVLREVALRLGAEVRAADTVARVGGDEFVILAAGLSQDEARALVRRARAALTRPFTTRAGRCSVTGSFGIAIAEDADTPDSLVRAADAAMYAAKRRHHARHRTVRQRRTRARALAEGLL